MSEGTPDFQPDEPIGFKPNFNVINQDQWEALDEADRADAQRAFALIRLPVDYVPRTDKGYYELDVSAEVKKQINEFGLDRFVNGFKQVRKLYGEEEYGGLEPRVIDDTNRTSKSSYLNIVSERGMIFSNWKGLFDESSHHDIDFHLVGMLLTTKNMTDTFSWLAGRTQGSDEATQEKAGRIIDGSSNSIHRLWKFPPERNVEDSVPYVADRLLGSLEDAAELVGNIDFDEAKAEHIAVEQCEFVIGIRDSQMFLPEGFHPTDPDQTLEMAAA